MPSLFLMPARREARPPTSPNITTDWRPAASRVRCIATLANLKTLLQKVSFREDA
jgi:hypothetical protein